MFKILALALLSLVAGEAETHSHVEVLCRILKNNSKCENNFVESLVISSIFDGFYHFDN